MTDDVLAVRYSPDGRFVAVALLDATVKVFHQDTLKFFLSLYGHKVRHFILELLNADFIDQSGAVASSSSYGYIVRLQAHHHLLCR